VVGKEREMGFFRIRNRSRNNEREGRRRPKEREDETLQKVIFLPPPLGFFLSVLAVSFLL
jgi:hypothetical protein